MKRFLGIGLTLLLVIGAIFIPQGWFALKDASIMEDIHGGFLDPLAVTQLDRSYERNIYDRMSAYMEAAAIENVMCSQKEVDPESDSLLENLGQAESSVLMMVLLDDEYLSIGSNIVVESCSQYTLMRKSDGQILLVANDLHLVKEDGCHMELLIDGVDGTVYYLESEENIALPGFLYWSEGLCAKWLWMLCDNYQIATVDTVNIEKYETENTAFFDMDKQTVLKEELSQVYIDEWGGIYVRLKGETGKDTYCCRLYFGPLSDSWTMEMEEGTGEGYAGRIRLGFHSIIQYIPELAERVAFVDYWSIGAEDEEVEIYSEEIAQ